MTKTETKNKIKGILKALLDEVINTREDPAKGPYKSTHEGLGAIREEYMEFEADVFDNKTQDACMEAIQLAASAINFVIDFKQPLTFEERNCLNCKFSLQCIGPRDHGCRRFPERLTPENESL